MKEEVEMRRLLDREWGFFILVGIASVIAALAIMAFVLRG